jgi:hypothetical protein
MENLTELELKVYEALKESEVFDDVYCEHPSDISYDTGIPIHKLRGVISSLIKKDIAYMEELVEGCGQLVVLFEQRINN